MKNSLVHFLLILLIISCNKKQTKKSIITDIQKTDSLLAICAIRGHAIDTISDRIGMFERPITTKVIDEADSSYLVQIDNGILTVCERCGSDIYYARTVSYVKTFWKRK